MTTLGYLLRAAALVDKGHFAKTAIILAAPRRGRRAHALVEWAIREDLAYRTFALHTALSLEMSERAGRRAGGAR